MIFMIRRIETLILLVSCRADHILASLSWRTFSPACTLPCIGLTAWDLRHLWQSFRLEHGTDADTNRHLKPRAGYIRVIVNKDRKSMSPNHLPVQKVLPDAP
ncbi:hypothetical protein BDV97DRAFT_37301 [Delphinella strobiligena]|nr:hypothetical protein BDV97DRAFT_37301 [Delphinella strobiligena]